MTHTKHRIYDNTYQVHRVDDNSYLAHKLGDNPYQAWGPSDDSYQVKELGDDSYQIWGLTTFVLPTWRQFLLSVSDKNTLSSFHESHVLYWGRLSMYHSCYFYYLSVKLYLFQNCSISSCGVHILAKIYFFKSDARLSTYWFELILDLAIFRCDTLLKIEILAINGEDLRKIHTGHEPNQMVKCEGSLHKGKDGKTRYSEYGMQL